jgi:hypothetical protein
MSTRVSILKRAIPGYEIADAGLRHTEQRRAGEDESAQRLLHGIHQLQAYTDVFRIESLDTRTSGLAGLDARRRERGVPGPPRTVIENP